MLALIQAIYPNCAKVVVENKNRQEVYHKVISKFQFSEEVCSTCSVAVMALCNKKYVVQHPLTSYSSSVSFFF